MQLDNNVAMPELHLLRDALDDEKAARALASAPGGWRDLAPSELQQLNLSDAQQRAVRAMQDLCQRSHPELPRDKLLNPEDVARVYQHRLGGVLDQLMIAVALDADGRLMQQLLIGKHTGHGYGLDPVHVLRPLIRAGAEAFVIVQNHPSGEPKALPDQRFFAEKLARAAKAVDLFMIDFLVIGGRGDGWLSYSAEGLLQLLEDPVE
jgi:DNA repair protein RadC